MPKWSNDYIKIPFVEKGRDIKGCDCWGLVRLIYKDHLDVTLPSLHGYDDTTDYLSMTNIIDRQTNSMEWQEIELGKEKPFDVLVFRVMNHPVHVGVVVDNGWMIHCERGQNTLHSDYMNDRNWSKRLEGIYRHVASTDSGCTV